ncbi:unnamed protein product [Schistosoma mattheei]|uniref:Uncharacterized protein n=1 Tax=Schistosoma mattheei TaxID=31246 RepID=A0A183Q276_9TREM|nr:unnamed protein product [Schistosoma mattheei]
MSFLSNSISYSFNFPIPIFFSTPSAPSARGVEKNSHSVTSDSTKAHSTTPARPLMASKSETANLTPA